MWLALTLLTSFAVHLQSKVQENATLDFFPKDIHSVTFISIEKKKKDMMRYDWLSLLELECLSKHLPQWVYRREESSREMLVFSLMFNIFPLM